MVSTYETGQRLPALKTPLKMLSVMGWDLCDLNEAVRIMADHWAENPRIQRRPILKTIHELASERWNQE